MDFLKVEVNFGVSKATKTYMAYSDVLEVPAYKKQMFQRALRELNTWKEQYKYFKEFDSIIKEITMLRTLYSLEKSE